MLMSHHAHVFTLMRTKLEHPVGNSVAGVELNSGEDGLTGGWDFVPENHAQRALMGTAGTAPQARQEESLEILPIFAKRRRMTG